MKEKKKKREKKKKEKKWRSEVQTWKLTVPHSTYLKSNHVNLYTCVAMKYFMGDF